MSWRYRSSWYLGWQCNHCRYEVFTNSADARQHLQDIHNQQPPDLNTGATPLLRGPLNPAPAVWIGAAAIAVGLLLLAAVLYIAARR